MADRSEATRLRFEPFTPQQHSSIEATLTELVSVSNPFDYHTFMWGDREAMATTFTAVMDGPQDATMLVLDAPPSPENDPSSWYVAADALADAAGFFAAADAARGTGLRCEVTWVDRYGNCQLNIGPDELAQIGDHVKVEIAPVTGERTTRSMRVVTNFTEIGAGVGLVIDSFGMLAICVDRGSAAAELAIASGDSVRITALAEGASVATGVTTPVTLRR